MVSEASALVMASSMGGITPASGGPASGVPPPSQAESASSPSSVSDRDRPSSMGSERRGRSGPAQARQGAVVLIVTVYAPVSPAESVFAQTE